jgi:hypothetical protein
MALETVASLTGLLQSNRLLDKDQLELVNRQLAGQFPEPRTLAF